VEGNDSFTNELEILNEFLFIWSFLDSKNRIVGAGTTD
jgi:hypothetical protein